MFLCCHRATVGGMSSEWKPLALLFLSAEQKHTEQGKQRGQNDFLAFFLFPSCCSSRIRALEYIAEICCTQRRLLDKHCLVSFVTRNIPEWIWGIHCYNGMKNVSGCRTIERRAGESVMDVSDQRVRDELWVCRWKLCRPVETLTALSKKSSQEIPVTDWRHGG